MKTATIRIVSALLLASAVPLVHAAPVSYSFEVAIDSGALAGQTFSGNLSFDDAALPSTGIGGEDLFALTGFNFVFGGGSFALADLSYGDAAFTSGQFLGLDAGGATFSFVPASGPFAASFAFDFGSGIFGNGDVQYTLRGGNDVPEPGTAWLVLPLLLGLAGARRFTAHR